MAHVHELRAATSKADGAVEEIAKMKRELEAAKEAAKEAAMEEQRRLKAKETTEERGRE